MHCRTIILMNPLMYLLFMACSKLMNDFLGMCIEAGKYIDVLSIGSNIYVIRSFSRNLSVT